MPVRYRNGRWEVRVSVGGGRRVERTLPAGATRDDAKALETTLVRRQIAVATGQQPDRLISEALDQWVRTSASHLKSWDHDLRYRVDVLRGHIDGKRITEIPAVAEKLKADGTAAGLKPATINRYLAILRRIGNLALRWGWTDVPVGQRIDLVRGERQRDVYLTPAQVRKLARKVGGEAGDAVMLAALTGLRRGELLRLTTEMIQPGALILDSNTKSGRPRAVPLTPEAARIARRRLPWKGLTPKTLRSAFEAGRTAAGMPQVRFHDLRHAFGSWVAGAGIPLTELRDMMGHSSLTVTSRYAHVAAGRLRETAAVLDALTAPKRRAARG